MSISPGDSGAQIMALSTAGQPDGAVARRIIS
jgi:hypothetical protein